MRKSLLYSFASLSPPLALKSGSLLLPYTSDPFNLEIIPTPDSTLLDIQHSSSTHTQSISSTPKTGHSPTPPPTNLQFTNDNVTNTVLSKKKYSLLEDPVSILPPVLQPVNNLSRTNTLTDEFRRIHLNFKPNLVSLT